MRQNWWVAGLVTLAAASGSHVVAPSPLDADPPARVGRLNYMTGSVSFRPASSDEWAAAVPNRPLTTGDRIWTDNDSRAEVHVGSTVIRVNAQTEIDFTNVDDNTLQLRLAQGSISIRVRHIDDGQVYEIDAPNGAISLNREGEYRVDVGPDGATTLVTVWSGNAEVTSAGSSFAINARQKAEIKGTDSPTYDLSDAPGYDDWDQWCVSRDQREDNAVSARYVSREMPGYEDLDQYGRWRYVDGYGEVWAPSAQPAGWAPYHTGRWVWVDPWGWTWVDDAPWGYAPYHYGRWAYVGDGWAWIPGQMAPRPVYAPALVVFVGAPAPRPGVAVAVGFGAAVAWFALGPQEVYRPAYTTSPRYVQQVNVTNVTNVTNITNVTNVTNTTNVTNVVQYRNRTAPGAMVATSNEAFTSARPVQSAVLPITGEMRSAPVTGTAPPVAPTRASLAPAFAGAGALATKAPPASVASRPVMARLAPPAAPVSFAAQQQQLASNGGRPLAPTQVAQLRQSAPPNAGPATLFKPAAVTPAAGGLKPARGGLTAAAPVAGVSNSGFVSRPVVAAHPAAQPTVAQPTTAVTPTASRVPQPPTTTGSSKTGSSNVARPAVTPNALHVAQPPTTGGTSNTPQPVLTPNATHVAQPPVSPSTPHVAPTHVAPTHVAQPHVVQPNVAQPNVARPNVAQPNMAQPNVAKPNVPQANVPPPNVAPHVAQPRVSQPPATTNRVTTGATGAMGGATTTHGVTTTGGAGAPQAAGAAGSTGQGAGQSGNSASGPPGQVKAQVHKSPTKVTTPPVAPKDEHPDAEKGRKGARR